MFKFDELQKMDKTRLLVCLKENTGKARSISVEMGKILVALESKLQEGATIAKVCDENGIKLSHYGAGTMSARIYKALVPSGKISEEVFDNLTFEKIRLASKAIGADTDHDAIAKAIKAKGNKALENLVESPTSKGDASDTEEGTEEETEGDTNDKAQDSAEAFNIANKAILKRIVAQVTTCDNADTLRAMVEIGNLAKARVAKLFPLGKEAKETAIAK